MLTRPWSFLVRSLIGLGATVLLHTCPAQASGNLLTNPGAELNGTGWVTIANGGDGMSYDFDGVVRSGSKSFQTSHGLDSISQTVDLFDHGYSENDIGASPAIRFSVWVRSRPDQGARYYVKFKLLQQDGTTVISSINFGAADALISLDAGSEWIEISHVFENYDPGVRYAYIEFGGQDQSVWAGNYGAHFDDASITIADIVRNTGGGGSSMPASGYIPPTGPFTLSIKDHGSNIVHAPNVTLLISASTDVDRMALSRYEDFHDTGITPLASSMPWHICGETAPCPYGTYRVYSKFYQAYGVSSPVQQLEIQYTPEQTRLVQSQSIEETVTSTIPRTKKTTPIPLFTRNLRSGDQGVDVQQLQKFLNTHGHPLSTQGSGSLGKESMVFGPALRRALIQFQEANHERLLVPFELKKGTGTFGTQTRLLVNELISNE